MQVRDTIYRKIICNVIIMCLSIHSWACFCAWAVVLEVDEGVGDSNGQCIDR